MNEDFFDIVSMIDKLLRLHHVSYPGITDIMALIYPHGRDTIFNAFADSVENQMKLSAMKRAGLLGRCKKR